jgi:cytoskeletal protein CcmA (bactofilin family)
MSGSFFSDLTGQSNVDANYVYSDNVTINSELDLSDATIIGDVLPNQDNIYNLGSNTLRWANVFANSSFNGPSINVDNIYNYTPNTNVTLQSIGGDVTVNDDFEVTGTSNLLGNITAGSNVFVDGNTTIEGQLIADSLTSFTTNGNLVLAGNGTGNVTINDPLFVDSITSLTLNGNLVLNGNGTGKVVVNDELDVNQDLNVTLSLFANNIFSNLTLTGPSVWTDTINAYLGTTITMNNEVIMNNNLNVNNITSRTLNTNLVLAGNGTGIVVANDPFESTTIRTNTIELNQNTNQIIIQPNNTGTFFALNANSNPASNRTLTLPDVADGTIIISNGAQTIPGTKTFTRLDTDQIIIKQLNPGSPGVFFENSASFTTRVISAATTANRVYTMPESGANAQFVMNQGDQDIFGFKYFQSPITIKQDFSQLVFLSTVGLTQTWLSVLAPPAGTRVVTLPSTTGNCSLVITETNQTVNGEKTLSGITRVTNTTNSTSATTGALRVTGGAAINRNLYVGTTTSATDGVAFLNNTASYIPAILNYYEVFTDDTRSWTCRSGVSATVGYALTRMGNLVFVRINPFQFTIGNTGSNAFAMVFNGGATIPIRFRPLITRIEIGRVTTINGGSGFAFQDVGSVHVYNTGLLEIYRNSTMDAYSNLTNCGIPYGFHGHYMVS